MSTPTMRPQQLDLFEATTRPAASPASSATVRHAAVALRCAGTVDRLGCIARAGTPSRPVAGGAGEGIRWETSSKGITVSSQGACSTFTWRALDGSLAAVLTPGLCAAIAAWSARWCSMHDTRPYSAGHHRPYRWSTYLYVTDLARAIERDAQAAAVERLVSA